VSKHALEAAQRNMESAGVDTSRVTLLETDFRSYEKCPVFEKGVDVIITNPPMGRRVPLGRLRSIIDDLFSVAGEVLKKGGRFVFVNPLKNWSVLQRGFSLVGRSKVDMGGFDGWLEIYIKHQR
jgi:tRNA G10  N-methylase Trm11